LSEIGRFQSIRGLVIFIRKKIFGVKNNPNFGVPQNYLFENGEFKEYKVGGVSFE
jgi:hypothetical protein